MRDATKYCEGFMHGLIAAEALKLGHRGWANAYFDDYLKQREICELAHPIVEIKQSSADEIDLLRHIFPWP